MAYLYPHLLSPFTVNGHTFKNRILCGPLGYNQVNLSAAMSQDNIDYFGALARGGTARVTTGDCMVSDDAGYGGGGGRPKFYASPMEVLSSIKTYVNTIHRYNCLAFVQLGHNGAGFLGPMEVEKAVTAEEVAEQIAPRLAAMTVDELHGIIGDFVRCVKNLRLGGVDGILIHGGHAAKIQDQLRSRLMNRRTDEYGGSLENRCRFTLELLRAVREAAGPDMLIEYRFSAQEYVPGGITLDETIEFLKLLEAEHTVDIFHVSGGMHIAPGSNAYTISPATFPPATFREDCRKIREAGIRTPLALINSLADPDVAEDIIASGIADFVVMSRQINLADPYYPRKLRENKPWLIDGCLRCHGCYDVDGPCSVNPYASYKTYESSYELPEAKHKRKVCIVGGGIAGLKAAFTAAERGHRVILFEKEPSLGGQLRFADTDTYKTDIRRYKNNMIRRCEEHPNIELRLGVTATPELLRQELPCALIVAVGAKPRIPDIPGVRGENVLTIMDSYLHPERLGKRVILLGSGLTACEVGLHLHRTGYDIAIIGRRDAICYHENFRMMPTAVFSPIPTFLQWFDEYGFDVRNGAEAVAITDGGVRIRDVKTGQEQLVPGDTVVLAAGMDARSDEAMAYNDIGADSFWIVGDAIRPHKIRDAVSTAFWAAMEV